MKKGIHPDYHPITVVLTNGERIETRSVYGKPGEEINVYIDPTCHHAWTGEKQVIVDNGRVSKFNKKYKNFAS